MLNSLAYFLQKSPDCYHAVATVAALLEDAGFTRLSPGSFSLRGGGTYYLTLGGAPGISGAGGDSHRVYHHGQPQRFALL